MQTSKQEIIVVMSVSPLTGFGFWMVASESVTKLMKKNGLIYSNMFFLLHPNCHCWAHSWPGSQSEELLYLLSLPPAPVAAVLGRIICPSQPGHSKGTFRLNDEKKLCDGLKYIYGKITLNCCIYPVQLNYEQCCM